MIHQTVGLLKLKNIKNILIILLRNKKNQLYLSD
jgi:hypothetical protein